MTTEEWKDIERELSCAYGSVDLLCDGIKLGLRVQRTAPLKYSIFVYVNGEMKGEWLTLENEYARRFFRKRFKSIFRKKDHEFYKVLYGKRKYKKEKIEMDKKKIVYLEYFWDSPKALIRHLKANNKEISIIKRSEDEETI